MTKKTQKQSSEPKKEVPAEEPQKRDTRKILIAGAAFLIGIVLVWVAADFFLLSYQIGDQKVRLDASSATKARVVKEQEFAYRLHLQYPNGSSKYFPISDTGLTLNTGNSVSGLNGRVSFLDRLEWWKPVSIQLNLKADQSQLADFITQNVTVLISRPTNANIKVSNGSVSLTNATIGKEYGLSDSQRTIEGRVSSLSVKTISLVAIPVDPTIAQSNLTSVASRIRQIISEHVAISVDSQTISPTSLDISSWLSIAPNQAKKTVDVTVNDAEVANYLNGITDKYSQVKRDQVIVQLEDGMNSTAVDGQDGVVVSGQQDAQDSIDQSLLNGKDFSLNLPVITSPFQTVTAADWPKWIEVNLTTKRMYVYQGGQTVNTFLVSAGKPSTPTPVGTFYIWEKLTVQTMSGPGYVQPDVPWINYFDHSGDAIHGNYWRPESVFGSVNTSHGCVGLQVSDAEWVYDWAPDGTPVVIHE